MLKIDWRRIPRGKQFGPRKKSLKRTFDYKNIDWNKKVSVLAKELETSTSQIYRMKLRLSLGKNK